jgi:hypothetical protein
VGEAGSLSVSAGGVLVDEAGLLSVGAGGVLVGGAGSLSEGAGVEVGVVVTATAMWLADSAGVDEAGGACWGSGFLG